MAKDETPFRNKFAGAQKAERELKSTLEADRLQRLASDIILSADDLSGDYDFERALFTTLGGKVKRITNSDLEQFRHFRRQLGAKYKGGITVQQIINFSTELVSHVTGTSDRDRAQKEIHTAFPVTHRGGRVQFQTNAGKDSEVSRHHVVLEFMDYPSAVATDVHSDRAAQLMCKGKVKIDCDCARQRYFFRYIASVGNFNAGRHEDGTPKITNPTLKGVACKHIVKVAALVKQSGVFRKYATRMIEQARRTLKPDNKVANKLSEMQQLAEEIGKENNKSRAFKTTAENRAKRQATPSYKRAAAQAQKKALEKAAVKAKKSVNPAREIQRQLQVAETNMRNAGLPDAAIKAALKSAERELRKAAK